MFNENESLNILVRIAVSLELLLYVDCYKKHHYITRKSKKTLSTIRVLYSACFFSIEAAEKCSKTLKRVSG